MSNLFLCTTCFISCFLFYHYCFLLSWIFFQNTHTKKENWVLPKFHFLSNCPNLNCHSSILSTQKALAREDCHSGLDFCKKKIPRSHLKNWAEDKCCQIWRFRPIWVTFWAIWLPIFCFEDLAIWLLFGLLFKMNQNRFITGLKPV